MDRFGKSRVWVSKTLGIARSGRAWPRKFSTQWKKFSGFFHTMEKMFPQCGKLGIRAVFGGFRAVLRGC